MQSTLFTTLTSNEEANFSGGWYYDYKPAKKPATPATPTPGPITVKIAPVTTQVAINTNTGDVKGDLTQTAANVISFGG